MAANSIRLSRNAKLERIAMLQEKKRRLRSAKTAYAPHPGQLAVHRDTTHPIRMVTSGNGFGKTCLGANEAIWACQGFNPITTEYTKVPCKVIVLLDSPSKVEDIWIPELSKWADMENEVKTEKLGKPHITRMTFKNGSSINFMFHLQEALAFEGIEFDFLIADEPFPRPIWIALTRGARKKFSKPRFLLIGTLIGAPWMYTQLWLPAEKGERKDVGIFRGRTAENQKNLADGYIEQFSKNLTEQEKLVRLEGIPGHLEGLALAHLFKSHLHVIDPFQWPRGKPVVVVIDPHQAKPHTVALIGATGDGRVYYIKEMNSKAPPNEFARLVREFCSGYNVLDYIIDSLGETPGTGGDGNMSFAEKLRSCGVPVRSTTYEDKDDEEWIQRIKQVLELPDHEDNFGRRLPKLAIFRNCIGLINDIETVQWLKMRNSDSYKPKLDISSKDYLSLLKYALASHILFAADLGIKPKIKRPQSRSPWSGRRR
jgi:hypothetical protein